MSDAPFTEADIDYLLNARKVVHSVIRDTTEKPDASLLEVVYRIVRSANPDDDIKLRLHARRPKPVLVSAPRPRPSAALLWHNVRIRGIDRKIVHPVIKNGVITGKIRGWHEHQWTDADGDRYVVHVNRQMKNIQEDFRAVLRFCMKRWRIELQEGEDRQQVLKFIV
jgi:hypothetical protein